MNILFSPVGTTDPVSDKNYYDGSMLHICRHYNIDKVYLYMTKEMWENHQKDNRYLLFIEKLSAQQNRNIKHEIIADKDRTNVQEYDQFYIRFEEILDGIIKEKAEDDNIFVNVSSGTPAMKSALIVLQDLKDYECELVQVSTPERKSNDRGQDRNPDWETFWDLNVELESKGNNRCGQPYCPSLSRLRQENIIKRHIDEYDYRAAVSVARGMEKHLTGNYINELVRAMNRYNLNLKKVDNDYKKSVFDITPVKSGDARKLFEYALWLNIKLKREEYIDFVRGITPIIAELFEIILNKRGKVDVNKYCKKDNNNVRQWDEELIKNKLPNSDKSIKEIIEEGFRAKKGITVGNDNGKEYKWNFVKSAEFVYLIEYIIKDEILSELVKDLRSVEEKVRNIAAHDIIALDANDIKNRTDFKPQEIIDMIKKLFFYTNFSIKPEYWNSYEAMNKELKRLIDDHGERKQD